MSAVARAAAAVTPAASLVVRQATSAANSSSLPSSSSSSMDQVASQSSASQAMKSISSSIAQASQSLSTESQIASGSTTSLPSWMKGLGIGLAVGSGVLIGASFVFKKKGLLSAQRKYNTQAGESFAYLKSPLWWFGMTMMIVGEVLNFLAYSMTSAILVTPFGALSVVISAVLSSIFLKEKLTLFGKIGCFLCVIGSVVIALNGPPQHAEGAIEEFEKKFIAPGFLVWGGICIAVSLGLIFFIAPKYGKKSMLVYISICSLLGGLAVSCISGIGGAVVTTIQGNNQFKHWFLYFLIVFVVVMLVAEIVYLNKALELFNTAGVTPVYYVLFTSATLVTSIILSQGLDATVVQIITIVLGFLTICAGITLLQISKIDPEELTANGTVNLDRDTTLLLRASKSMVGPHGHGISTSVEDPGIDSVRGGIGVIGSIVRARSSRRIASSSADAYRRMSENGNQSMSGLNTLGKRDLERYELHDRPMPLSPSLNAQDSPRHLTVPLGMPQKRDTAISFASGSEDPHGHHAQRADSMVSATSNRAVAGSVASPHLDDGKHGGILLSHGAQTSRSTGIRQSLDHIVEQSQVDDESGDPSIYDPTIHVVGGIRQSSVARPRDLREVWKHRKAQDSGHNLPSYQSKSSSPFPLHEDDAYADEKYESMYNEGHKRDDSQPDSLRSASSTDSRYKRGGVHLGNKRENDQALVDEKDVSTLHTGTHDETYADDDDEAEELLSPVMREAQSFTDGQQQLGNRSRPGQHRKGASILSPRFQKNIKNFK